MGMTKLLHFPLFTGSSFIEITGNNSYCGACRYTPLSSGLARLAGACPSENRQRRHVLRRDRSLAFSRNQNAYIERFNRTYRNELLDLYLFRDLGEVIEATYWWMIEYNEQRPHDSLDDLTPTESLSKNAGNSAFRLSA
jgi:hypothetical protein